MSTKSNDNSIKWEKAMDLCIGDSIKSLSFTQKNKDINQRFMANSIQYKAHILYCYYHNIDSVPEDYIVHHKNEDKTDDSIENLELMTTTQHKKHHGVKEGYKYLKNGSGKENNFYGKKHTDESKKKMSDANKGKQHILKNITKDEFRKIMSDIAKKKPAEKTSNFRRDIKTEDVLRMYNEGMRYKDIAKKLDCTHGLIISRVRKYNTDGFNREEANHKIEKIEFLEETEDVYNMEVEDTENYFIDDAKGRGVLIHNCSYRLAQKDKKNGIVKGYEYYTNSTCLPAENSMPLVCMLEHQDPLLCEYTGGSVQHIYMGASITGELAKSTIKTVCENFKLPYLSLSPTFSVCDKHGVLHGDQTLCPACGSKVDVYKKIVGYIRPVRMFNKGKILEHKKRHMYSGL
jgi:anaerobic ribonucleoside-triphosphate reductase